MSGKSRKTGNLVALGSAAVVAVYGAGFMRTADAAERFTKQSDDRQEAPEASPLLPAQAQNDSAAERSGAPAATASLGTDITHAAESVSRDAGPPDASGQRNALAGAVEETSPVITARTAPTPPTVAARVATATVRASNSKVDATTSRPTAASISEKGARAQPSGTPAAGGTKSAVATSPGEASSPPATAVVPSPRPRAIETPAVPTPIVTPASSQAPAPVPMPAASSTSTAAPATASATTPAPAPAAPALRWKDGEYNGYGSSRHGDIEVYLETTDGKITYIKISQCLTQYSCSWISDLPGQVLARQSANVDRVSGATQSANAFYYAVVQALAKAK